VGDIDTVVVDSLKALDLEWPIREADVLAASQYAARHRHCRDLRKGNNLLVAGPVGSHIVQGDWK